MKINLIKKLIPISLMFAITFFSACDFLASDKKMLDYYSNNSNYEKVTASIISKEAETDNTIIVDIKTQNSSYVADYYGYYLFHFYFSTEIYAILNEGDTVVITSAPMIFYNGQILPIIALERAGEILIAFEEGKAAYLDWIENS